MTEIKKILIPIDFSANSDKVVAFGISMAERLGADIVFFHAISDFQGYDMMLVHPSFSAMVKDLEKEANERIANLVQDHGGREGNVSGKVSVGDAADEILKTAQEKQIDMIVIGTHGTKGLERILMGSTADRVIKKATCPVLIFNPLT